MPVSDVARYRLVDPASTSIVVQYSNIPLIVFHTVLPAAYLVVL